MAVCDGIIETLDKAQNSAVHHSKLLKSLKTLHDATDLDGFFDAFVTPLCAALVIAKKAPVVERVLDFVAKFAASVAPLNLASEQEDEDVKSGNSARMYKPAAYSQLLLIFFQRLVMVKRGRRTRRRRRRRQEGRVGILKAVWRAMLRRKKN